MVPGAGIEPARLAAGDFESTASTNFTTRAGIREAPNYGTVGRMKYPTIEDAVGNTPLVALQRIRAKDNAARGNVVLGKLEGNNPAGSVKDRPALSMIRRAEERGDIRPGDTLIEATAGNTGIALARARCSTSPATPTTHASITKPPAPRSGSRRAGASRTL